MLLSRSFPRLEAYGDDPEKLARGVEPDPLFDGVTQCPKEGSSPGAFGWSALVRVKLGDHFTKPGQ